MMKRILILGLLTASVFSCMSVDSSGADALHTPRRGELGRLIWKRGGTCRCELDPDVRFDTHHA